MLAGSPVDKSVKLFVICVFPPSPSILLVNVINHAPEELKEELTVSEFACGPFWIVEIKESTLADRCPISWPVAVL